MIVHIFLLLNIDLIYTCAMVQFHTWLLKKKLDVSECYKHSYKGQVWTSILLDNTQVCDYWIVWEETVKFLRISFSVFLWDCVIFYFHKQLHWSPADKRKWKQFWSSNSSLTKNRNGSWMPWPKRCSQRSPCSGTKSIPIIAIGHAG